jgi:hypothetical protein
MDTEMISEKYQATFIHIPKTGGSTISSALSQNTFKYLPERINKHKCSALDPHEWTIKHSRIHELDTRYQNFYCFTFVRNPWDLMVSSYSWWTQKTSLISRKKYGKLLKQLGFKSFIISNSSYINECYHKNEGQLYWLNDTIDFVGKFENLQQDFNTICDKIGIPHQQLPHKNKSKHKHYTEYYDDETREIVAERYAKDIESFGYKFGD